MTTMQQVRRTAAEAGATIEFTYDGYNILAPPGFVWSDGPVHALLILTGQEYGPASDAHDDAIHRMSLGLDPIAAASD